jgi:hypothetical protein
MDISRIEKAIEDAWIIATTHDLTNVSDQVKDHYKNNLKYIVKATLDAVRKEQNHILYEIENKIK